MNLYLFQYFNLRCKFKTSTFGLLAANALFALLRMQNTNYIVLALLEEMLAVTSMVFLFLELQFITTVLGPAQSCIGFNTWSILPSSEISYYRPSSNIVWLFICHASSNICFRQIMSAQLPSLIFHSSYEARTGFRVAISLIDFASASCLAMAFLKKFLVFASFFALPHQFQFFR